MASRTAIPTEIKRRVLVEAGHRCAIPTCRYPAYEVAHIEPYSKVKQHEYQNLIALCPNCHTRYDKGEIDRQSMLIYKRKIAFLSDRYSKFELNVMDYLRKNRRVCVYGYLTVKNLMDDKLIENTETLSTLMYDDETEEVTEFVAALTSKGKKFLQEWADVNDESLTY